MRNARIFLVLFLVCLFFIRDYRDYSEARAQDNITIIDHSIKAVETVSSGRFIKTSWKVKLCNHSGNPADCVITISFMNKDEQAVEEAKKTVEIKANETKTYSDTVLLRATLAQQIVSTRVSIQPK